MENLPQQITRESDIQDEMNVCEIGIDLYEDLLPNHGANKTVALISGRSQLDLESHAPNNRRHKEECLQESRHHKARALFGCHAG